MAQAILAFDPHPADRTTGFELGRDYARYALTPPLDVLARGCAISHGWESGRALFAARTLAPGRHVRTWLALRLSAWRRGLAFEGMQVTPNYLGQIDAAWCPITREALTRGWGNPSDASIDRVRDDAGHAAGNLAVMSARANAAKGSNGFDEALAQMRLAEANLEDRDAPGGLDAAEWGRVAVLCSFVTELPHDQAAGLPLLVLPPNRLRLFNPAQALQALVTRQFGAPGWSGRVAQVEALLPPGGIRRDFQRFVHALLPRVLEGGRHEDAQALRCALEDAWRDSLVLRRWSRFARQLTAAQAEKIVLRASKELGTQRAQAFTLAQATDGWALERGGIACVPLDPPPTARPRPLPPPRLLPAQLALSL